MAWTDTRSGIDPDIFALQILAAGTVDVPAFPRPGITFARPSPNPARGSLTLRFVLPHETRVRLAIYDAIGRRVRELTSGAQPAGEHAIAWDLHDQGGYTVSAGLYFARLEAGGRSIMQKIAALR